MPSQTWFSKVYNAQGAGKTVDLDLGKMPKAVFLNTVQYPSRGYRKEVRDMNNAILNETKFDNRLDPEKWKGNGFQGHVQYVTYFGKKAIGRNTVSRDLQMDTFPKEMSKPLNTSQFGRGKDSIKSRPTVAEEETLRAGQALSRQAMDTVKEQAHALNRTQDHHRFFNTLSNVELRESLMGSTLPTAYQNLRSAGLSSINPSMGTSGSLPDLKQSGGRPALDAWRKVTPWAYEGMDK